jgi:hypothetical protein
MSDSRRPDPSDEEAWDAIVADLRGQLDQGTAPEEEYDYIDAYFDEGYTPPDPPPITAPPDAIARAAWAGALGGPIVALGGYVLGFGPLVGAVGIIGAIAGFAILVARRERHVPPGKDHGDGAVV